MGIICTKHNCEMELIKVDDNINWDATYKCPKCKHLHHIKKSDWDYTIAQHNKELEEEVKR